MARFRIGCREADRLLSQERDAPLGRLDRMALWSHLRICESCRTVRRNFDFLSRAVRRIDG